MFGVAGESVVAHGTIDFRFCPHRFHQAVSISMILPFQHFVQPSLQPTVGEGGLDTGTYGQLLVDAAPAVTKIRTDLAAGGLPCFGLASRRDDLEALVPVADRIRGRYRHCVVLGTGGSSLGAQTLLALAAPDVLNDLYDRLGSSRDITLTLDRDGEALVVLLSLPSRGKLAGLSQP